MQEGGNTYDKYATANPVERRLVGNFLDTVVELARSTGATAGHEVGCGEGEVSMLLAERLGIAMRGSDVSAEVCEEAGRRAAERGLDIAFTGRPIEDLEPERDGAELIVCCEVIEHLPDPGAGVAKLAELAQPWALLSVPREPLWRALNLARGAYVRDWGNTPGHLNHFGRSGFRRLLSPSFEIVALRSPLPWTMALCRAR